MLSGEREEIIIYCVKNSSFECVCWWACWLTNERELDNRRRSEMSQETSMDFHCSSSFSLPTKFEFFFRSFYFDFKATTLNFFFRNVWSHVTSVVGGSSNFFSWRVSLRKQGRCARSAELAEVSIEFFIISNKEIKNLLRFPFNLIRCRVDSARRTKLVQIPKHIVEPVTLN